MGISAACAEPLLEVSFSSLLGQLSDVDQISKSPLGVTGSWSSFDRSGGNDDGQGFIRKEGDDFVIAEMSGPGAVTRIWCANPKGTISIYLDDGSKPVFQKPLIQLFSGASQPFSSPFAAFDNASKTGRVFLPIPYSRFCKITLSQLSHYQIDFVTHPKGTKTTPLALPLSKILQKNAAAAAQKLAFKKTGYLQNAKDIQMFSYTETLPAGETIELTTFTGSAAIQGIECKWPQSDAAAGRDILLAMYWDDELAPDVLAPAHDFFGAGTRTLFVGMDEQGTGYCYYPMPFHHKAQIHLINDNLAEDRTLDITIYIKRLDAPPVDLRYFSAYWTRDNDTRVDSFDDASQTLSPPFDPLKNYVAFDHAAKGHWVGLGMIGDSNEEGDVMVIADSGDTASWADCGMDGFWNGHGGNGSHSDPFSATLQGENHAVSRFRFFPFPTPFQNRLWITQESGHANLKRSDMASIVYWYRESAERPTPWILPNRARQFRKTALRQPVYEYRGSQAAPRLGMEGEQLNIITATGIFEPQDMSPHGPDWSHNQQLYFEGTRKGSSLLARLPELSYSGWFWLSGVFTHSPDSGMIGIRLQDRMIESALDLYDESIKPIEYESKQAVFLHAGEEVQVEFFLRDQHPDSQGWGIGIDRLELRAKSKQPDSLAMLGPFIQHPEKPDWAVYQNRESTGLAIAVGYPTSEAGLIPQTLERKTNASYFSFRPKKSGDTEAYFLVTWAVAIERSGIYRFELSPQEIQPFLIDGGQETMRKVTGRIWVNGVALESDPAIRFDGAAMAKLPTRYPLPLREGGNQISWMLSKTDMERFSPALFGVPE